VIETPVVEMPAPLRAALARLEERERELRDSEAAVAALAEALHAAHRRDVQELAAAREAGNPDPRSGHEESARRALQTAEHEREVMVERVAQVRADYARVAAEQHPVWMKRLENAWRKTDASQRRRAEELDAGFGRQRELRAAWAYVDALMNNEPDAERTLRKALAAGATATVDLEDLLAAIEDSSAEVMIARTNRSRDERREREQAATVAQEAALEEARRAVEQQHEGAGVRRAALAEREPT
jgi:hypothetical protein